MIKLKLNTHQINFNITSLFFLVLFTFLLSGSSFAQTTYAQYTTAPRTTPVLIDGVEYDTYQETINEFVELIDFISTDGLTSVFQIEMQEFNLVTTELNTLVEKSNANNSEYFLSLESLNRILNVSIQAEKYTSKEIAHLVLWENGFR